MKEIAKDFKNHFWESVNKYHLPTQNKSIFSIPWLILP